MAINKNLVPINSTARARELGSKGGKVVTDKQRRAAKIREIKKRVKKGQIKCVDEEWLLARLEDSCMMDMELIGMVDDMKKGWAELPSNAKGFIIKLQKEVRDSIHKKSDLNLTQNNIKNEQYNIEINILPPNDKNKLDSK